MLPRNHSIDSMEEFYLKPLLIESFFDIMPSQSPYFSPITSTIVQHLMYNISQSMALLETTSSSAVPPLAHSYDSNNHDNQTSSLDRYRLIYRNYHGIISSFVCIFGLTCNLFNIIVLTRPSMRSSTNTILTSLALSDLLKMLIVLPAVIIFYCLPKEDMKSGPDSTSYFQVRFYMIHMLFTLTLHCISTWLTVYLAAFRYVFLRCKKLNAYISSPDRALIGVSMIVLVSTILCIPSYAEHRIVPVVLNDTLLSKSIVAYRFEETAFSKSLLLREKVFVLHSVIFKLIPCVFLLLFSFLLIQQLRHALEKSEILYRNSSSTMTSTPTNNGRIRARKREKENRRTTLMLVIVCVLFLVTELPQGAILLLTFLSKTHSEYYFQIYQHLGDTFDILALINNSVNFILYCLMSRAFRDTFKQTFCLCLKVDHQQSSTMNNTHLKQRKRHLNQTITCQTAVQYRISEGDQTSLVPSRKSSSDHTVHEKKQLNKALQLFNHPK